MIPSPKVSRLLLLYSIYLLILVMAGCGRGNRDMVSDALVKYLPNRISDFKAVDKAELYDRDTIFKYMDGAGEVYLQYDFRRMAVRRYLGPDSLRITCELFDMGKASDAYGIFTHSREDVDFGIGQGSEFKGGLLSFWKGRYFACVYCDEQTAQSDSAVLALGRSIDTSIEEKGEIPAIAGYLAGDGLIKSHTRFFHRYTSLNLHYYISEENLLNLDNQTDAVLAEYGPDKIHLLLISYPIRERAEAALAKFKAAYIPKANSDGIAVIEGGKWAQAQTVGNFVAIIFDSPDQISAEKLMLRMKGSLSAAAK